MKNGYSRKIIAFLIILIFSSAVILSDNQAFTATMDYHGHVELNADYVALEYGVDAIPDNKSFQFIVTSNDNCRPYIFELSDYIYLAENNGLVTVKKNTPVGTGDVVVILTVRTIDNCSNDTATIFLEERNPLGALTMQPFERYEYAFNYRDQLSNPLSKKDIEPYEYTFDYRDQLSNTLSKKVIEPYEYTFDYRDQLSNTLSKKVIEPYEYTFDYRDQLSNTLSKKVIEPYEYTFDYRGHLSITKPERVNAPYEYTFDYLDYLE